LREGEPPDERQRLGLLERPLPPGFAIRLLVLEPGERVRCEAATWNAALIEVECGEVDLHFRGDRRLRMRAGDAFWLSGLPVRSISNPSRSPAALTGLVRSS
jgi:hypothetical protein